MSGEHINNLRLRPIIDMRDTDKSRYFTITEFKNCFIIGLPSLISYFNHFLAARESDLPFFPGERRSNNAGTEYHLQQKTGLRKIEQTIICRQLSAGHVVGSRPMDRKKKLH